MSRQRTEEKELIARNVRADDRRRVTLGAALQDLEDATFNIYRDGRGRIILEPQISVPAAEVWLFRNKQARDSVERGLKQLAQRKTRALGSFARHADDDEA